ncbi:TPA: hypothetical protein KKX01_002730 [Legionella pneumophila]|nr:hypothetical protein [Legionella pneumophila]
MKMSFILQEEIVRLGNANNYELFILKAYLENIIYSQRKCTSLTSQISVGANLLYFDKQLLKEDVLLITELGKLIKGIRQSDKEIIHVEPQSFNFDRKNNFKSSPKIRVPVDEWQLPMYHRVVVDCYHYVLKGYFIKFNHNGSKLKLLGGETIKLPSNAVFYEANTEDMLDFTRIEQDPFHQNLEYEETVKTMRSKLGKLDPTNSAIDHRKIIRFMTGRGFMLQYIEKAIEEIFGKR